MNAKIVKNGTTRLFGIWHKSGSLEWRLFCGTEDYLLYVRRRFNGVMVSMDIIPHSWWHAASPERRLERILMALQKPKPKDDQGRPVKFTGDKQSQAVYPTVCEYLTTTQYGDGSPRQTSTIVLCADDGAWKAAINDRDNRRSLWVTAPSLDEAVSLLEEALNVPQPPWRSWGGQEGESERKTKRRS